MATEPAPGAPDEAQQHEWTQEPGDLMEVGMAAAMDTVQAGGSSSEAAAAAAAAVAAAGGEDADAIAAVSPRRNLPLPAVPAGPLSDGRLACDCRPAPRRRSPPR